METTGEHLKRVRKTCGYSLEDVAHITKINLRYLEAIENEEFSKIPGETFLLGFLRSYARFLGINEKELISNLKERKHKDDTPPDILRPDEGIRQIKIPSRRALRIILPLSAGAIALLIIIILFGSSRNTATIQSSNVIKKVDVAPETAEIKHEEISPPAAESTVPSSQPVLLKVSARELAWIQVKLNKDEVKEVLLKPGESAMWQGEDKITMTLGNAGGIDAEINGKRQEPFGKSGEVVRNIVITSREVTKGVTAGITAGVTESVLDSSTQSELPADTTDKKIEVTEQEPKNFSPLINLPP